MSSNWGEPGSSDKIGMAPESVNRDASAEYPSVKTREKNKEKKWSSSSFWVSSKHLKNKNDTQKFKKNTFYEFFWTIKTLITFNSTNQFKYPGILVAETNDIRVR